MTEIEQARADLDAALVAYRDAETATRAVADWTDDHFGHVEFVRVRYVRALRQWRKLACDLPVTCACGAEVRP